MTSLKNEQYEKQMQQNNKIKLSHSLMSDVDTQTDWENSTIGDNRSHSSSQM